jgi:aminoglycoside 2'-N-acetyltransferase I
VVRATGAGLVSVLLTRHTADLSEAELHAVRGLLDAAFDDFTDQDWDHALGGQHALVVEGGLIVAHGSLVMRRMLHRGMSLRTGYVEAVAVHPEHRREGHAGLVMDALEQLAPAYELLALSASDDGAALYRARGWQPWRGPSAALSPKGLVATPDDDGSVYVFAARVDLDLDDGIACDWREGDVW